MTRKPARDTYDAVVGIDPRRSDLPEYAYAVVKLTYAVEPSGAKLSAPTPLLFDIRADPPIEPRFPPGTDYWLNKPATDVIVRGSAFSGGSPRQTMEASVKVGQREKRVAVFGRRYAEWSSSGSIRFTEPEPFEQIPLLYQNAYGGFDGRVPVPEEMRALYEEMARAAQVYDHPGLYPRNPVGKGYLVLPDPVVGHELPNLEDPADLLAPERLITGSPELWHRQPLPWCFEWTVGSTFPRSLYLGAKPWFPGPEDHTLPEVQRGLFPNDASALLAADPGFFEWYCQDASLGMVFREPLNGARIVLMGMHPSGSAISFDVPEPPTITLTIEGEARPHSLHLTSLVAYPAEKVFTMTYVARAPLPRVFIPEIHAEIPISASINGDTPVVYEPPATIYNRLKAAGVAPAGGN